MERQVKVRLVVMETVGLLSALVCVATLVWPHWIEAVFQADPDRESGGTEWLVAGLALVMAVTSTWLAVLERARQALSSGLRTASPSAR